MVDISSNLVSAVSSAGVLHGTVHVFVAGSTAAVTTIEYESGAISDLKAAIGRMAPAEIHYAHDARWGDGNGRSHVRAAIIGPSLCVPVRNGAPLLGTWQQVIIVELDIRARDRKVHVTVSGSSGAGGGDV